MDHPLHIPMQEFPKTESDRSIYLLNEEIEGTYLQGHNMAKGSTLTLDALSAQLRVLLLLEGQAVLAQEQQEFIFDECTAYIPYPNKNVCIQANTAARIIEICWDTTKEDQDFLCAHPPQYPFIQRYSKCPQYTEYFKSEGTISRTLVPHHILPRFSMGSNEAGANDFVALNNHPMIDQYFFSFPNNDILLLFEQQKVPYQGNTLVHVPLGCYHGVEIGTGQYMHYIWIDFLLDHRGLEYLDTVHVPILPPRST